MKYHTKYLYNKYSSINNNISNDYNNVSKNNNNYKPVFSLNWVLFLC